MSEYNLPNFLVVGAAKSGTTSLFNYLKQHPEIFIPERKECRFFSEMPGNFKGGRSAAFQNNTIDSIEEYEKLFEGQSEKFKGDLSTDYFYYAENSIPNIKQYLDKNVFIFIILRNPVDRAYSHYLHNVRVGSENKNFKQAIKLEKDRISKGYAWTFHYIRASLYYGKVKSFVNSFENASVFILEKSNGISSIANKIIEKMGLDSIAFKEKKHNQGFLYSNKIFREFNYLEVPKFLKPALKKVGVLENLRNLKKEIVRKGKTPTEPLMDNSRQELYGKFFSKDIEKLEKLLDKDLKIWKESELKNSI